MDDGYLTGELARLCGVSADTIRHYERSGVIPTAVRGANGYRRFPADTPARVALVRRALSIGFSLEELARIVRERASGRPPCRKVRALAEEKLADLDRRIAGLVAARADLAVVLEEWEGRLAAAREGEAALLLESFAEKKDIHEDEEHLPTRSLTAHRRGAGRG